MIITHERVVAAPADRVGALLATLGSADDRMWRTDVAEPMWLDQPIGVGAAGGHGPVRYRVTDYVPGRRVRFDFEPGHGMRGHHAFEIVDRGDGCLVRHRLVVATEGAFTLLRPLLVALHDATVEDVFDHVERSLTGSARRVQRTRPLVRRLGRRLRGRWVEACDGPHQECWMTALLPGDPVDPRGWTALVRRRGGWWRRAAPAVAVAVRDRRVHVRSAETGRRSSTVRSLLRTAPLPNADR
ncbi:hypothetical protein O7635_05175 [Asanoa sp. WMMD1127]|uniref:SRPBCC family protein n=1 Tax=Asanoa sp. WMMD1127 TaxID=3016107 RepID=UPI002416CBA2|nr:SRPBCC family protein [Asanoa sp. WMMD1127]MDG4821243.1 hypothetical protein [Asanoa sp. WMMD1127]